MPTIVINSVPMAKLRLRSTRRSTSGCSMRSSQTMKTIIDASEMPEAQQIHAALNQSSCWPRSRMICSVASQRAMTPKPM